MTKVQYTKLITRVEELTVCKIIKGVVWLMGAILIIEQIFNLVGWLPGYHIQRIRTDSIKPLLYLFPGQNVRLSGEFFEPVNSEIENMTWTISKKNQKISSIDGIQPTITIPFGDGGVYNVEVKAKTLDTKKFYQGNASFYVVQDKPKKMLLKSGAKLILNNASSKNAFFDSVAKNGLEIIDSNGQWKATAAAFDGTSSLVISADTQVGTVDGNVFLRPKGAGNVLNYGIAPLPSN